MSGSKNMFGVVDAAAASAAAAADDDNVFVC